MKGDLETVGELCGGIEMRSRDAGWLRAGRAAGITCSVSTGAGAGADVGMVGQLAHLANFVQIPGCWVTGLAELRPRLGRLAAERFGIRIDYPPQYARSRPDVWPGAQVARPREIA